MENYEKIQSIKPLRHLVIVYFSFVGFIEIASIVFLFIGKKSETIGIQIYVILLLIIGLLLLTKVEWWYINNDLIIARNSFKTINKIALSDIKMVEILPLHIGYRIRTNMYVINNYNNAFERKSIEINSSKYPEFREKEGLNSKKSPFLIPVNEITRKYLEKYIKK